MVDQLEIVDAALYQIRKTEKERHAAHDQHKKFVVDQFVLNPVGKAVLNRGNYNFNDGKLKKIQ